MLRHQCNDQQADEDANQSPEDNDQVSDTLLRVFAMPEKVGYRVRYPSPRRVRNERIQVSINIKRPCSRV